MAKYIAHASIDEKGKIAGGAAGDQTAKEVCIRTWYSKSWHFVLRIGTEAVRKQFANNMIDIAKNNNVGYDQNGRNTLLTQAIKVNFDFTKIAVKCECDCSSMVTIALLGAIYTVLGEAAYKQAYAILVVSGNCATTSTLRSRMRKLTMISVVVYDTKDYTDSISKAVFGDIYIREGSHVVAYIGDGNKVIDGKLKVDGEWGRDTTTASQKVFGTIQDGEISHQDSDCKLYLPNCLTSSWEFDETGKGSYFIRQVQTVLADLGYYKGKIDGLCGKQTVMAIQAFLNNQGFNCGKVDGCMGEKTVMAWQMYINSRL